MPVMPKRKINSSPLNSIYQTIIILGQAIIQAILIKWTNNRAQLNYQKTRHRHHLRNSWH